MKSSKLAFILKKLWNRFFEIEKTLRYFLIESLISLQNKHVNPNTLLLVRFDGIGDYILFRNFIEEIKKSKRFAGYSITLCCNNNYREIAESFDQNLIKDFIWINTTNFRNNISYRLNKLKEIHNRAFEVVLNPVYSRISLNEDSVVRASKASHKIGMQGDCLYSSSLERMIYNRYYSQLITIDPNNYFEFYRNKEFFGNVLQTNISLQKPLLPRLKRISINNKYSVICPFAQYNYRKWSLQNYIQVADYLHNKYHLKSIFVGSIKDNISEHENRLITGREHIINYIGKNSLVQTISIIQNAFIIISNDTGLAHIGAISKIPIVVVSNGNHYGRFTEYPKELGVKVLYAYPPQLINSKLSFSELVQKYQYRSDLDINTIGVEMVFPLIDSLLK